MEDVLDLYHEEYDPDHPVVCFDETSKQLVADKRPSIGARPGRVERYDYEYKRGRNLFRFTFRDCCGLRLAYPHTETIRLVDNPLWVRQEERLAPVGRLNRRISARWY